MSKTSGAPIRTRIASLLDSLANNARELATGRLELSTTCRSLAQRIHDAASKQEKARKAVLVHPAGIETLQLLIANRQDALAACTVLQIFNCLATSRRRCVRLAGHGIVDNVWSLLISRQKSTEAGKTDKCLQQCLLLLVKLAPFQKKFAIRARLVGGVNCICALIKTATGLHREPVLKLIRLLGSNASNATAMVKNGAVDYLTKLLSSAPQHDMAFTKRCIDALLVLCKHKCGISGAVQQDLLAVTMNMASQWTSMTHKSVKPATCSSILGLMKSLAKHEAGRQALIKADGFQFLIKMMQSSGGKKEMKKLALTSAGILRYSFPRTPLPVVSLGPQIRFKVPEGAATDVVESNAENDAANSSSSEAGSEDDERGGNPRPAPPSQPEDLHDFRKFFVEMQCNQSSVPSAAHLEGLAAASPWSSLDEQLRASIRATVGFRGDDALPEDVFHLLPFAEPALSDVHPELSPWRVRVDEPQTKTPPAVGKKLMLDDAMRYIEPEGCLHRLVYDLDQNVSHAYANTNPMMLSSDTSNDIFKSPLDLSSELAFDVQLPSTPLTQSTATPDARKLSPETRRAMAATSTSELEALRFDSRFECGNLRKAIQVRDTEYDLVLNADVNTDHHHQWFYFSVSGMLPDVKYRFNIVNCEKTKSQFTAGMQPVMFSWLDFRARCMNAAASAGGGCAASELNSRPEDAPEQASDEDAFLQWKRVGTDIAYHSNHVCRCSEPAAQRNDRLLSTAKTFYTLSFSVTFPNAGDICYLAYHYPYTYTRLQRVLSSLHVDEEDVYLRRQLLCKTLTGNDCHLLTIGSPDLAATEDSNPNPEKNEASASNHSGKQYIVISSRVHPGESNSSWVMEGILQFLVSAHPLAVKLRERYIFKVVPMLNPDGVVNGHHRCSLSGNDLNRQWITPCPVRHPTIYHTKCLLQYLFATGSNARLFCDLHGHSRRKNIFTFGCLDHLDQLDRREEEVFPNLLASVAPAFARKNCTFDVDKSKEATARVVGWRELGIVACYTMESTYCGADQGQYKGLQFSPYHLKEMGEAFCQALLLLDHPGGRASALRADDVLASARRVPPATFATPESDEEEPERKAAGRKLNKKAGAKGISKNRAKRGDDDDEEEEEDEEEQQAQACAASSDVDEASYEADDVDGEFGAGDDLDDFDDALDEEDDDDALQDGSDEEEV
ncbi:uncharacterized protein LOC135815954 isoform X2 [Sycon ciliatum]|uniref:uncharacterized protein LOC135815954 isoform X2 n=1 Tax=Sycon ciliatum TaxID=27933 RepID=UPI0031F65C9B